MASEDTQEAPDPSSCCSSVWWPLILVSSCLQIVGELWPCLRLCCCLFPPCCACDPRVSLRLSSARFGVPAQESSHPLGPAYISDSVPSETLGSYVRYQFWVCLLPVLPGLDSILLSKTILPRMWLWFRLCSLSKKWLCALGLSYKLSITTMRSSEDFFQNIC